MKSLSFYCITFSIMIAFFTAVPAFSQENATVEEVYEKVLQGVQVLEGLGEEGLQAFNDPNGEFVWKDSNIAVSNCSKKILEAVIYDSLRGKSSDVITCAKTGKKLIDVSCENEKGNGYWIEYWWPNRTKNGEIERRLTFCLKVPGKEWLVVGSVWNDNTSADELNAALN